MSIHICTTKRFHVLEQQQHICNVPQLHESLSSDDLITKKIVPSPVGMMTDQLQQLPVLSLYDILEAHGSLRRRSSHNNTNTNTNGMDDYNKLKNNHTNSDIKLQRCHLYDALQQFGFVLIRVPKGRAATTVHNLRTSLQSDFFPTIISATHQSTLTEKESNMKQKKKNLGNLSTSSTIYVSERGIPMYKLGYELCTDNVREVFRIATGHIPDSMTWPKLQHHHHPHQQEYYNNNNNDDNDNSNNCTSSCTNSPTAKSIWTRSIGLFRHVTDAVLDLLLLQHQQQQTESVTCMDNEASHPFQRIRRTRPYSGARMWWNLDTDSSITKTIQNDRIGDYSMLYAMHYFNDGSSMVEPGVSVKEHADPSLLVVEPFLCTTSTGLQVWDRINNNSWIDCDGPNSPMHPLTMEALRNNEELMLLFVGKALSEAIPCIAPTLHRVVSGHQPRHTIIYEQKYAEFYPTPTFD